jgi:hypothetical protein
MTIRCENSLLAPNRSVRCLGPRRYDGMIIPEAPDLMCGTDRTTVCRHSPHPAERIPAHPVVLH